MIMDAVVCIETTSGATRKLVSRCLSLCTHKLNKFHWMSLRSEQENGKDEPDCGDGDISLTEVRDVVTEV